jgi:hypothetical protein
MLAMKRAMHHRSVKSLSAAILLFCCSNNLSGAQAKRFFMSNALAVSRVGFQEGRLREVTSAFESMKAGLNETKSLEGQLVIVSKENSSLKEVAGQLCRRNHTLHKTGIALLKWNKELEEENKAHQQTILALGDRVDLLSEWLERSLSENK